MLLPRNPAYCLAILWMGLRGEREGLPRMLATSFAEAAGECSSRWATTEMATKKAKICCAFPCVRTYPSLGITSTSIVKR